MIRLVAWLLVAIVAVASLPGCSRTEEEAVPQTESGEVDSGTPSGDSQTGDVSRAARARGVPVESGEEEGTPVLTFQNLTYDWRVEPEKGLMVTLDFGNENEVFERVRAYVFVSAWYSAREASSLGTFPWGVGLENGEPVDYTKGTHVVYRKDHTMKCFIPYTDREGYYDTLRIIVYSEEGAVLKDQRYQLEVEGVPTGPVKTKPVLTL